MLTRVNYNAKQLKAATAVKSNLVIAMTAYYSCFDDESARKKKERKGARPSTRMILGPWSDKSETVCLDGMDRKDEDGKAG
jgi:hypothetical protein